MFCRSCNDKGKTGVNTETHCMRPLLFLTAFFFCFLLACHEKTLWKEGSDEQAELTGKWKLTEYLADPGNGSGRWQTTDPSNPSYLEFRPNGVYLSHGSATIYDRYRIRDKEFIVLSSSSTSDSVVMRYALTLSKLIINPPCIEACGQRYVRVH
jgi:hypothetical protein